MRSIKEKLCVVTGAAKSIGLAVARRYIELGAKVALIDIDPDVCARAKELRLQGCAAEGYVLDVSSREDVFACFGKIRSDMGRPVYALVNNAGVVSQNPIEAVMPEEWLHIMAVNVYGSFYCIQAVLEDMKAEKQGKIINFSSKSGKTGSSLMVAYSTAKGAIITMTQAIAHELAPYNINCNCLCPGIVDNTGVWQFVNKGYMENLNMSAEQVIEQFTAKVPLRRLTKIEDVVDYVEFLTVSGEYCTGQALNISGGREMN